MTCAAPARPRPRTDAAPAGALGRAVAYARANAGRFVEALMELVRFETSIRLMERLARLPSTSVRAARRPRSA